MDATMTSTTSTGDGHDQDHSQFGYVLFVTTKGGIIIELYKDTAKETCERFIHQIYSDRYKDTIIHRIVKNLFIQCGRYTLSDTIGTNTTQTNGTNNNNSDITIPTTLKSESTILDQLIQANNDIDEDDQDDNNLYINDNKGSDQEQLECFNSSLSNNLYKQLLNESETHHLKFNERGLVALGIYNQLVITLDSCDALNGKYPIFGKVHSSTLHILKVIEQQQTNNHNCPIEPIVITNIHFLKDLNDNNDNNKNNSQQVNNSQQINNIVNNNNNNNNSQPSVSTPSTPISKANSSVLESNLTKRGIEHTFDSTPVLKRLKTKIMTGLIRTPSRMIDDNQHPIKTFNLNQNNNNFNRSLSMPYINTEKIKPKWPTRLVIIRHGQSEQNALIDILQDDIDQLAKVRDCDIKLTEVGKWQAQQTGLYFKDQEKFDICFTSPYDRAIDTAQNIISQLPYKLKVYKDNWLREKEFGRWHGLNESAIKVRYPEEYTIRQRDGKYWYRFPGGENYLDVEMRIHCFLEKLSRDYAGRSVLIVTHQVPYKLFRGLFHHLDEHGLLALENVHNCGIQEYILDTSKASDGRMKLKHFNHRAYDMKNIPKDIKERSDKLGAGGH